MKCREICFITCVNDEKLYSELLYNISKLAIPKDYTLSTIPIRGATSIYQGYKKGQQQSQARYKIYIHQDVAILQKEFLIDMIKIFESNERIGVIGMVGTKEMPPTGTWWQGKKRVGKVYDDHTGVMSLLGFDEVIGSYVEVAAIDGLLIASAYDFTWRAEIFEGWHFYDASYCKECQRAGYIIVVPNQKLAWAMHKCHIISLGEDYYGTQKKYMDYYRLGGDDGGS